MASTLALLGVTLLHLCSTSMASDPDPVRDFSIPNKNSSSATVHDFTFSGIKDPSDFTHTGFSSTAVNSDVFPGLNSLGLSFVRADFGVGGINPPHFHPRASETAFVLQGRIYSGFVDSHNTLFAKVLERGEVMVFPQGMLHFQMNVGDTPATILGAFNSQNPGLMRISSAVFGSGINEELLQKAFGLSSKEIGKLRRRFEAHG